MTALSRIVAVFLAMPILAIAFVSPLRSDLTIDSFSTNARNWGLFHSRVNLQLSAANVIIAGAPASGKGTQCEVIKEKFGVVHLSTGDMLRAAVAAGTEVGILAKDYMDSGKLVPDEVIIGVVCALLGDDVSFFLSMTDPSLYTSFLMY